MELLKVLYSAVRKNSLIHLLKSDSISLRMDSGIFPLKIMPSYATLNLTRSQRHSFLLGNFQLSSGGTSVLVFFQGYC